MKKFNKVFLTIAALYSLLFVGSCEIGLGEAVDTQSPVVTIDYPPEAVIIREKFVVSGTCTDDMGIDSVKVTLNNTETGKSYGPFKAEVANDRWTITLNEKGEYNGFMYPDGRYSVNVYAIDGSEKESGVASRAFDIDNTAPVLYLSKPLSVGSDAEFSTFGKQVKLAGDISEDHATEYLSLHFKEYNNDTFGNQSEIKIENVTEMSSDTPLLIARYYSADESKGDVEKQLLRDRYLIIYGSDADGNKTNNKKIYCTIELCDNARIYQTVGDAGVGEGNKSDRYFINSRDFANTLVAENKFNLSVNNMKKYINGTSTLSAKQKKEVEKILKTHTAFYVNSEEINTKSSKFIINPDNNPTFYVEGYETTNDSTTWNVLNSDSSFTVDINAGKDSIYVKPNTVKISVSSLDGSLNKVYVDPKDETLIWSDSDDLILRKTITVAKADGFLVGKAYKIEVSGTDRDGNDIMPKHDQGYGFNLQSSSAPPKLTIEESTDEKKGYKKDKYYSAQDVVKGFDINFTVETDTIDLIDSTATPSQDFNNAIKVSKNQNSKRDTDDSNCKFITKDNATINSAILNIDKPKTYSEENYKYKMSIKVGGDADSAKFLDDSKNDLTGIFKYNFYITAIDSGEKSGSDLVTFYVDNEPPVVSGFSVSIKKDSVKKLSKAGDTTNKYINGKVYVKARARDNYELKDITYWVYAANPSDISDRTLVYGGTKGISLGKVEDISINNIDTTNSAFDGKKLLIKFKATDAVGNSKEYETDFGNTIIDQTTDIPEITSSNFTLDKKKNHLNSSTNIFDSTSKLIGKIEDDDGLSSETEIKFYEYKDDLKEDGNPKVDKDGNLKFIKGKEVKVGEPVSLKNGETFTDVPVPTSTGFYILEINAKDNALGKDKTETTVIAVDNSAPTLTETTVNTEDVLYRNTGNIVFDGAVSDDLGLAKTDFLKLTINKTVNNKTTLVSSKSFESTDIDAGKYHYEFDFTGLSVEEGKYTFEFVATDLAGKSTTVTRTICKDSTPPEFATTDDDKPKITTESQKINDQNWYSAQTILISGRVSDNSSGVEKVSYSIDEKSKWSEFTGTTSFDGTITGLSDGTTIYIKAKDNAGNETDVTKLGIVRIDNLRPEMEVEKSSINNTDWLDIAGEIKLNGETDLWLKGVAEDKTADGIGASGLKKIEFKCGSSDFTTPDAKVETFGDLTDRETGTILNEKSWIVKIPQDKIKAAFDTPGFGDIIAKVTDKTGNYTELKLVSVRYDSKYPEAKISSVKYYETETNVVEANKKIVFYGTAQDNQKLSSVKLEYAKKETEDWKTYGEPLTENLYSWSFEVDTEATYVDEEEENEDKKKKTYFKDGETYIFRATAEDEAGNIGNSYNDRADDNASKRDAYKTDEGYYKELKINQDSDRPIITVSNLEFASGVDISEMTSDVEKHAHAYNNNTVFLTYADDDGIKSIEYKDGYEWTYTEDSKGKSYFTKNAKPEIDEKLYTDSGCVTESGRKVKAFTPATDTTDAKLSDDKEHTCTSTDKKDGTWKAINGESFNIEKEGPHIIVFRVTDGRGTVFVSDLNAGPKLQDNSSEHKKPSTVDNRIYIDVDTKGPELGDIKYSSYNSSIATPAYGEYKERQSDVIIGGNYTKFQLSLVISDPNGVESVTLSQSDIGLSDKRGSLAVSGDSGRDGAEHEWQITDIPISKDSKKLDGQVIYSLLITDYAGNTSDTNLVIDIDNKPAEITVDTPTAGEQLGTAFIMKGYLNEGDSETKIKYYTDAVATIPSNHDWSAEPEISYVGSSWRLNVDGRTSAGDNETHTPSHKKLFVDAYGDTKNIKLDDDGLVVDKTTNEKFLELLPLYFHFLVTDKAGNTSTRTHRVMIDPQGDIPTIETTYPVYPYTKNADNTDKLEKVSGKVRVQGKAEVKGDNKIVGVYIQIDPIVAETNGTVGNFDGSKWEAVSLDAAKDSVLCPEIEIDGVRTQKKLSETEEFEYIFKRYNENAPADKRKPEAKDNSTKNMYAIYVGKDAAWNYTINTMGELENGDKNTIGIRVYVVDSSGNINILNTANDKFITLDSDAPQIGTDEELYLFQFGYDITESGKVTTYYIKPQDAAKANPVGSDLYKDPGCRESANKTLLAISTNCVKNYASIKYRDDISLFVKGEWWLVGSATDSNGIEELKINSILETGGSYDILGETADHSYKSDLSIKDDSENEIRNGYKFYYRLGSKEAGAGELKYEIYAKDKTGNGEARKELVIKYDNKAPGLLTDSQIISNEVKNRDGFYTLSSSATENSDESGFARTIVYFKRTNNKKVYDTFLAKTKAGNALSYESLHSEDNLYWQTAKVSEIDGKNVKISTSDYSSIWQNANVHKGGFVKLGGSYYTLTADLNSTDMKVALDGEPSKTLKDEEIYFAIGNVIDYIGAESTGTQIQSDSSRDRYGYYTDSVDDDGDCMIESAVKTGNVTKWTASINSNNIPDGPIEIHYVVFDKAGNFAHGEVKSDSSKNYEVKVENNAPRLASVKVWCDFDGNGSEKADGSESNTYYYKGADRYINSSSRADKKATDTTKTLIVSGNEKDSANGGTPFMTVKNKVTFYPEIIGGNGDLYYTYQWKGGTVTKATSSFGKGHDDNEDSVADASGYLRKDKYGDSYITGHTGTDDSDASTVYKMEVTEANLGTIGNSTKNADGTYTPIWFKYNIYDSTDGCTAWTQTSNYTNGRLTASFEVALNVQYADTTKPTVSVDEFTVNHFEKETGHIELVSDWVAAAYKEDKTTVKDSHKDLDAKLKDKDAKVSGIIKITGTAYDDIRLKELNIKMEGHSRLKNGVKAADYSDAGSWTSYGTDLDNDGWSFEVEETKNDETGHEVKWTCTINTAFDEKVAELDRKFTITATDKRGGLTSDTGEKQMDIVPYITSVTTELSKTDPNNSTVYSRSALGHYPVAHVTKGFNSGAASWTKEKVTITGFNLVGSGTTKVDEYDYWPDDTENYDAETNNIPSLNNYNKNTAEYNYTSDTNHQTLNDDVYFDVWQFNSMAGFSMDTSDGSNGKADNLIMKINPSNGMLGFAFSNSSEYFSMPAIGDSASSYNTWTRSYDYLRWNALAFDKNGNSFACTVGGDLNGTNSYADTFNLYIGLWGSNGNSDKLVQGTNNSGSKSIQIDTVSQQGTKSGENTETYYTNKNRFQNQSIATHRNDDSTDVYMAYYDAINNEIRFKAGELEDSKTSKSNFGHFTNQSTTADKWEDNSKTCNIIADGSENSLGNAGPYVSIGVTNDNRVVLVWYDNQDLWYTYTKTSTGGIPTTADLVSKTGVDKTYWATATKIMENAGKYCQLVVDSDNGVHVAAYDELNSSLNYVYIPTATDPANPKSAFVDSYLDVGENLTIDVAKDGDYQVPYIGYWGGFNEKPRYAYLYDKTALSPSSDKSLNGVDISTDKYTGVWECTTVPVVSSPNKNKINVGVWKSNHTANGSGALADSKVEEENKYTSSTAGKESGTCYGNGTSNGVLAYTISINGSTRLIETAQIK